MRTFIRARVPRGLVVFGAIVAALPACSLRSTDSDAARDESHLESSDGGGAGGRISFRGDGAVEHDPGLRLGAPIVVTYDVHRLTTCGTLTADLGSPVRLDLFFMTRSGHTHVPLGNDWADVESGVARATLPAFASNDGDELQLWIHATNVSGCEAWDSAEGENYHFRLSDEVDPSTMRETEVPPVGTISASLPGNGADAYVFTAKQNRKVGFSLTDGIGTPRPGFDARLTVVDVATNGTVLDQTTSSGSFESAVLVPPHNGIYRATVRTADPNGGRYSLEITTDISCEHDHDCPPTLTCQALFQPWEWSSTPGRKCMGQSTIAF